MGDNKKPEFLSKWGRSPAQHRRVVVDGKFVELTEPASPQEQEETNSALELVREERGLNGQTDGAGTFEPIDEGEETGAGEYPFTTDPPFEIEQRNVAVIGEVSDVETATGALSESEKFQAELEPIHLEGADAKAFIDMLDNPPEPNQELQEAIEKTNNFLRMPPVPQETIDFIETSQKEAELLSGVVESPASADVLDGAAGRTEEVVENDLPF
jgi:Protein of unknown function (DUF1778)